MEEKDLKAISRVEEAIDKINKKENNIFFFVIDTKGNPSGSLEYIYKIAYILKEEGYNITMLYQEEEFVGVEEWLGKDFSTIPHANINTDEINVSASDILFIPEIFSSIMLQTKKLPCKRIAILQNYDFILEQIPLSVQWGDYGIMDVLTNTNNNAQLIKEIFPYVHPNVVTPHINKVFGNTSAPKKMLINIVSKDQRNVNKIVKPFYWKYPTYKWVSFRDLRGLPKEDFATALREAAITIWVDDDTSFGYSAIEAMKSGSIVIGKIPEIIPEWMQNEDASFKNCCVWFDNFHEIHRQIASVVRTWTIDTVPQELFEEAENVTKLFSYEKTKEELINYITLVSDNRIKEMENIIDEIKKL